MTERLKIDDAAPKMTSVCFGGPHLDELFVTSALNTSKGEEYDYSTMGNSGSLFRVTLCPYLFIILPVLLCEFDHYVNDIYIFFANV